MREHIDPAVVEAVTRAVEARGGRRERSELRFTCPEAERHANGDAHPSARWHPGKQVWRCDVCGAQGGALDLARRLGVDVPRRRRGRIEFGRTPLGTPATAQPPPRGCTLVAYADAKGLDAAFLQSLGLSDQRHRGGPSVRIPYLDAAGTEVAVRYRTQLERGQGVDRRFCWRTGATVAPYGLWRLDGARAAGSVVLVEGESDCQTLWQHGVPALGIPGASTWRPEWASHLAGIPSVYVVVEPDAGGATLRERLMATPGLVNRLRLVELGAAKDASGLYLSNRAAFREAWAAALASSRPATGVLAAERDAAAAESWGRCATLASEIDILAVLVEDLHRLGAVGEDRTAKLVYLQVVSRLFDRPVSLALKGASSGGKSYTAERVLHLVPRSAYYALTAMSERAIAYSDEPLSHRILVLFEAAGLAGDMAQYMLRSLLSEGRIRYETVEKTSEGLRARLIERPGPTGLLVTTTAIRLHPENETRLLSVPIDDTPAQTARVLAKVAEGTSEASVDIEAWHALQAWIEAGERRVVVPFARELAKAIPPAAVRLRRDFSTLLRLIEAHALLHRATRDRDAAGRIAATLDDYEAVRRLVVDLMGAAVELTVPATVRETVAAVQAIVKAEGGPEATVPALAAALKLERTAAYRRARTAEASGYIVNREERKGRLGRYVPGEPLPADSELLPTCGTLAARRIERGSNGCSVAGATGGIAENNLSEVWV